MNKYTYLDNELSNISKSRTNSLYDKWNKSKETIDLFYNNDKQIGKEVLFNRLIYLKKRNNLLGLILLPIFLTIFFGFFVTISLNIIKDLKQVLIYFNQIIQEAKLTSILDNTILRTNTVSWILLILLIIISAIIIYLIVTLIKFIRNALTINNYVVEYEINKINVEINKES